MHIIDELNRNPACRDTQAVDAQVQSDPVLLVNEEGRPWTLGMVLSMWQFLFEESRREICSRGIAF